jgi:hypothetical protein
MFAPGEAVMLVTPDPATGMVELALWTRGAGDRDGAVVRVACLKLAAEVVPLVVQALTDAQEDGETSEVPISATLQSGVGKSVVTVERDEAGRIVRMVKQ